MLSGSRALLKRRLLGPAMLIRDDDPEAQAAAVVRRFGLAGRAVLFARCPRCNGRVQPVAKAAVAARIPPRTAPLAGRVPRVRRLRPTLLGGDPCDGPAGAAGADPVRGGLTVNET